MYVETEILFPPRSIPQLRDVAGAEFRTLVDHVAGLPEAHPESLAFTLMMIRLAGCLECETDSFRAMRGCTLCAQQTLRRYKSNERELIKLYKTALRDITEYLAVGAGTADARPLLQAASRTTKLAKSSRKAVLTAA
jgi:hypothetical protein